MKKKMLFFLIANLYSGFAVADQFADRIAYIEQTYGPIQSLLPGATDKVDASLALSGALSKYEKGKVDEALADLEKAIVLFEQQ